MFQVNEVIEATGYQEICILRSREQWHLMSIPLQASFNKLSINHMQYVYALYLKHFGGIHTLCGDGCFTLLFQLFPVCAQETSCAKRHRTAVQ